MSSPKTLMEPRPIGVSPAAIPGPASFEAGRARTATAGQAYRVSNMSTELLYSIRVLIIHPTLTLEKISDALNLGPDTDHCVGELRYGNPRGGM